MLRLLSRRGTRLQGGVTRRDFLRAGAVSAGALGLSLTDLGSARAAAARGQGEVNCILLFLVGGPSQLDTWDPKPLAPDNVRGPFKTISTCVPGLQLSAAFPRMAQSANQYAIVRSVHHQAAPIHETGQQLMQTGRLFRHGNEQPHYGAVLSHLRGPRRGMPPFVVLPTPIGNTGVEISHGQGAGLLGPRHAPVILQRPRHASEAALLTDQFRIEGVSAGECDPARPRSRHELVDTVDRAQRAYDAVHGERIPDREVQTIFAQQTRRAFDLATEPAELRDRYGRNTFGQSCLLARRLVEKGVRLATVNMFDTVFNAVSWDCHADGGALAVTLDDYRDKLCPMFDQAYTALVEDLRQRGLLETTLVLALGEFGRTPRLNACGGRDHWPGVWSILFAGAGIRGGQVIGASDRLGAEPRDRPVTPAEVAATVYHALGVDPATRLEGQQCLVEANPIHELWR